MYKKSGMRPPVPFEDVDSKPMTTEDEFHAGKSFEDGLSGRLKIDTTMEQGEATCSEVRNPYRRKH